MPAKCQQHQQQVNFALSDNISDVFLRFWKRNNTDYYSFLSWNYKEVVRYAETNRNGDKLDQAILVNNDFSKHSFLSVKRTIKQERVRKVTKRTIFL